MFQSINPATGAKGERFAELDDVGIERALATAETAWRDWRVSPLDRRTALLDALADRFDANKRELAEIATREMGKTLKSAIAEVEKCVAGFRHFAENGPSFLEEETVPVPKGSATGRWLPIGPVLAIMPWNFPYWQVVRFMAPAIMAGNVGLLKHASITQGVAAAIEDMARQAGAPEGVFQNLAIRSDKVAGVIADDRVAAVTLTGSEGAGSKVAEAAGKALKKVVLELGGSDPFIVMPSADIEEAAKQAVTARVQNTGQSCICGKRMIVHADIHDAFMEKFAAGMKAVKAGDPMDEATDMGPLSSFDQRDTVLDQVDRAKQAGATLLFGAEKVGEAGAFLSAGILTDVPRDSDIAREELFGPVAMVFKVSDIDEAITLANDIPYGLGSSVWTTDDGERERFERDIAAGMTAVNQMLASAPQAPFGGVKKSGHGRELGPWGMHEFMNLKTVLAAE
ncbi:NAD-dependent succinate-semialdehyde dehydrogenase [Stakelama saccharophila]|uniref:NAD-dependent succinate-semialdehyde dehydrogenase n=1 Tax=Stakelama saccharophila TaxID=3075605 RepID=A0ABZ0B729_9SPHN|nr:NAD-dependent succinate-semialdehyde dehydrogenase [Stakelama sp. W311]WNO53204.1 NAD-dependent succinate-semialdehyde dehydrogenase [Stakelama sp. W311]